MPNGWTIEGENNPGGWTIEDTTPPPAPKPKLPDNIDRAGQMYSLQTDANSRVYDPTKLDAPLTSDLPEGKMYVNNPDAQEGMRQLEILARQAARAKGKPDALAAAIAKKFPALNPDTKALSWHIAAYRNGYDKPIRFVANPENGSTDPEIVVEGKKPRETNPFTAVKKYGEDVETSAAESYVKGLVGIGNHVRNALGQSTVNPEGLIDEGVFNDPKSSARTIGNLIGEIAFFLMTPELAPEASLAARVARLGAEGAAIGKAIGGPGDEGNQKMLEYSLMGAGLGTPLEGALSVLGSKLARGGTEVAPETMQTKLMDAIRNPAEPQPLGNGNLISIQDRQVGDETLKAVLVTNPEGVDQAVGVIREGRLSLLDPESGATLLDGHPLYDDVAKEAGLQPRLSEGEVPAVSGRPLTEENGGPRETSRSVVNNELPDRQGEDVRPTVENVQKKVDEITKDWQNANPVNVTTEKDLTPEMRRNLRKDGVLTKKGLSVSGLIDKDGTVYIFADTLSSTDDVPAIVFHEMLGHAGLSNTFKQGLDDLLFRLHDTNWKFRQQVTDWLDENPKAYKNLSPDKRLARAAEEVLAEMSENGSVDPGMWEMIKHYIKEFLRTNRISKLDLRYTDGEIQAILRRAHESVTGEGVKVNPDGSRYIRTWHGTPHKFDKFDHSHMGSGEGAQVYGWGTYLTDTRKIAEGYRSKLAGEEVTWRGVPGKQYQLRRLMEDAVAERFGYASDDELPQYFATDVFNSFRDETSEFVTPEILVERRHSPDYLEHLQQNDPVEYQRQLDLAKDVRDYVLSDLKRNQKGHLYEVEIPDDAKFLEWDKPLADQPHVKPVLEKAGLVEKTIDEYRALQDEIYTLGTREQELNWEWADLDEVLLKDPAELTPEQIAQLPELEARSEAVFNERLALRKKLRQLSDELNSSYSVAEDGSEIYRLLSDKLGSDRKASEFLAENGVDGTKYLDGMSRRRGEGSYNYVMYNDNTPEIVNRYAKRRDGRGARGKPVDDFVNAVKDEMPDRSMTHEEALDKMDNLGLAPSKVMRKKMEIDPTLAPKAVQVTEDAIKKALTLGSKIARDEANPQEVAQYAYQLARAAEWVMKVEGYKSDIGRALNFLKLVAEGKSNTGGVPWDMLKQMDLGNLSNPDYLYKIAKMMEENKNNPEALTKIIGDSVKGLPEDYILSVRYNMMLSGLTTHAKNIAGNATFTIADLIDHTGAAIIGQLRRGSMSEGDRVTAREALYRWYGLIKGIASAPTLKDVGKSFMEGRPAHQINKFETGGVKLPGFADTATRLLAAEDSWFRSMIQNMDYYGMAARQANKEGLRGARFHDRVDELVRNPTKDMIEHADTKASVIQLVSEPSWIAQKIEGAKARPSNPYSPKGRSQRIGRFIVSLAVPFSRVPDNLIWAGLRRTPLGLLEKVTQSELSKGAGEADVAIARMVVGSAMLGWFVNYAADGNIRINPATRIPEIKTEGGWMSLAGMDAVSTHAALAVGLAENFKEGKPDVGLVTKTLDTAALIGSAMSTNAYGDQLTDLFTSLKNDEQGRAARNRYASSMASSFSPAFVRQLNQTYNDKTVRDTTSDGTVGGMTQDKIMASLPGLSDNLPASHDQYGRERTRNQGLSGLFQVTPEETDKTIVELERLKGSNGDKGVIAPVSYQAIKKYQPTRDSSVTQKYQALAGEYQLAAAREVMNDPSYATLSDAEKIAEIRKATTQARKAAREELFENTNTTGWSVK